MTHLSLPIFIFLTAFLTHGFAANQNDTSNKETNLTCSKNNRTQPTLNVKLGYFFFSDSKMQKIYDQGGVDVQLSGSYPLRRCTRLYGSVEYLEKHGRSLNDHEKTSIWQVPLSLGVQSVVPLYKDLQYYVTLGPRYFFFHAHNDSAFVDKNINQDCLGGFVNTGFNYFVWNCLFVNVFGEYSYGKRFFNTSKENTFGQSAQIGGFVFGAGLGYSF